MRARVSVVVIIIIIIVLVIIITIIIIIIIITTTSSRVGCDIFSVDQEETKYKCTKR